MKIGIIGGSFDPIHFGHLVMAEDLRIKKNLDKIIFIPTGNAPHKNYENSGEIRLEMVNLAISDNEYFSSCDIEIKNKKVTFTVDTLTELNKKRPDCEYYFIIGLDNLYDLEHWNHIEELGKLTKFLVSSRIYGNKINDAGAKSKCKYLKDNFGLDIEIIETPIIEISSSYIRSKLKNNESIRYLTPRRVVDFIYDRNLYK